MESGEDGGSAGLETVMKPATRNFCLMQGKRRSGSRGFSLVEVMIAMVVLAIGLLSILALFGYALASTQHAQEDLIAKQKARELLEAVYSARDDALITFAQIQNNNVAGGMFHTGFESLFRITPGTNGILATDTEGPTLDYVLAPDPATGNLNVQVPLSNYQRQIEILPTTDAGGNIRNDLRIIRVTVRVNANGGNFRNYVVTGYISSYH